MTKDERRMPKSARSGLTLAEVLVSMGILVIGLLGVAALFPVGGHYMQTGDVADQAGAIAQAALDDAIVRGHLNPENWFGLDVDIAKNGGGFTQPSIVAEALRGGISEYLAPSAMASALGRQYLEGFYGAAYVIDPLGMAAILEEDPDSPYSPGVWQDLNESTRARRFPATTDAIGFRAVTQGRASWHPWNLVSGSLFSAWPVRRVSTTIPYSTLTTTNHHLFSPAAEEQFTASDDPALILPDSGDDPSRARWTTWSDGSTARTAARQARGDYSWLISVSPGSSVARDALATSPDAHPYDVSVVVFHKRVLGVGYEGSIEAERLVNAKVVSTGTAGGELLLERRPEESTDDDEDGVPGSPFEALREGQYVMLTGPHPLSTNTRPMLFLQWYRVLTIEDSGAPILDSTSNTQQLNRDDRVLVSLRGPDWPWRPTGDLNETDQLPNDLRVAIIPGAVAVHTKTMRLESGTPWSIE